MLSVLSRSARAVTRPSSQQIRALSLPALHTPLPSAAEETFAEPIEDVVDVTTLGNGIRVVSVDSHRNSSSLGVFVECGVRHENPEFPGVTQVLEGLAFQSSTNQTSFRLYRESERLGAALNSASSRDIYLVGGDCPRPAALNMLGLVAEPFVSPAFHKWEVEAAVKRLSESTMMAKDPKVLHEMTIDQLAHTAAFGNNQLGRPMLANAADFSRITPEVVRAHWQAAAVGSKICVSATNVNHEELVSGVSALFGDLPASAPSSAAVLDSEPAEFNAGDARQSFDGETTSVGIFLSAGGFADKDLVHLALFRALLGGGDAFSAGGPGKGVHSRLYQNILCCHKEVSMANTTHLSYRDSGLFGVLGTVNGASSGALTEALAKELRSIKRITDDDLTRVKNVLKASVFTNLSQGHFVNEDSSRQLFFTGRIMSGKEMCAQIDAVTKSSLQAAANKLLSSEVAFVACGDLRFTPRYEEVVSALKGN